MFRSHRSAFLEHMADGDLALFLGARLAVRNHDVDYPFRQESGFWWLTGCPEPEAALILAKGIEGVAEETLFVLPRDPAKETWTGRRLGPEGAVESLGFAAGANVEDFPAQAQAAMAKAGRVWSRLGADPVLDELLREGQATLRRQARVGMAPVAAFMDPGPVLDELRLFKDEEELGLMRRAAAISAEAHLLGMAQVRPRMHEYELEALYHYTFRRHGCGGSGWAYPSIVAGGDNANILHYTANDQPLADGELVLVDAGGEYQGYAADITRTYPVNGSFTDPQRAVYEVVLAAQEAAIDAVRAGTEYHEGHRRAVESLCRGLVDLGVVTTSVEECLESESYRRWYMHNTGHWIGLDVHDCGAYRIDGASRPLEPGMVLTVEPGLYFPLADDAVPAELRGIGVRIEDDVHVTGGDPEILTAAVVKSVADVEAACAAERPMPPTLDDAPLGAGSPA